MKCIIDNEKQINYNNLSRWPSYHVMHHNNQFVRKISDNYFVTDNRWTWLLQHYS